MQSQADRQQLLTYGYVRNVQNCMCKNLIIPEEITEICLEYYAFTMVYFTTSYSFDDDREVITDEITGHQQLRAKCHVDGNVLFYSKEKLSASSSEANNIFEWHFKCYHCHGNDKIGIISSIDNVDTASMIYRDFVFGDTYFWWNANNVWRRGRQLPMEKTESWQINDIITVKLDVINWTLEYLKNNKKMFDQLIRLMDVNKHTEFYGCITFGNELSKYDTVYQPFDTI